MYVKGEAIPFKPHCMMCARAGWGAEDSSGMFGRCFRLLGQTLLMGKVALKRGGGGECILASSLMAAM